MWKDVINIIKDLERGLEFGGPTELFNRSNLLPLYFQVKDIDGVNKFDNNHFQKHLKKEYICDGILKGINYDGDCVLFKSDIKYDYVVNSHVIEHVANPIKCIKSWKNNLLKDNGYILFVVPDKNFCFDHRRPLTKYDHLLSDYYNNIGEEDNTHIEEQKILHDWSMGGMANFYDLCRNNHLTRVVHHHCFDIENFKQMILFCQLEIIHLFKADSLNIICLCKITSGKQI